MLIVEQQYFYIGFFIYIYIAHEEQLLKNELDEVRKDIEMENRTHTDVKNFLIKKRRWLEDKVEFWMEKYENDTEAKSQELVQLKADKERDLKVLQELARTYDDYEVNLQSCKSVSQSAGVFR